MTGRELWYMTSQVGWTLDLSNCYVYMTISTKKTKMHFWWKNCWTNSRPLFLKKRRNNFQQKNFKGEKSKWKVNIAATTHKNANNERGRRTHPQAKEEEEEGECFAEDVNFMPNKVNERATSIYIPLLWYYYIKKKGDGTFSLTRCQFFMVRIREKSNERKIYKM